MRLSSLAKLEKIELNKEAEDLNNKIFMLHQILDNRDEQIGILKVCLQGLVNKYGDARRTELTQIEENKDEKEKIEIVPEDVVVIVTHGGDIKRIPKRNFKTQHRKGVGIKTLDQAVLSVTSTNTIESLMIFTSIGKMYKLNVNNIPEGTNVSKGTNLKTILPFEPGEEVQAVTTQNDKTAKYVVFFTKNGLIKKTKIEEYTSTKRKTGIQAIKLKENDKLINVTFMNEQDIILITKAGNAIHIPTDDIKAIGRLTSGVKGIGLKENDEVISALIISSKDNEIVLTTSTGKGKRVPLSDFVIQNRGGRGVSCIKLDQGDYVAAAALASLNSSLLIIGKPNSICIPVSEITQQSKTGSGTKVIERSIVQSIVIL